MLNSLLITVKRHYLCYPRAIGNEPQRTQHYKKYTAATKPKSMFHLHCTRRPRTAFSKHLDMSLADVGSFYLVDAE